MAYRILVVDDSPFIHELARDILSARGYAVEKAMNGHEAMLAIGQSPPDLVLLDIVMPEMSGYQVCRLIRSDERTRSLPVVMMTAKDTQKDRFWGLEVGADAYITKPIDEASLLSTITSLLEKPHLPVAPIAPEELSRETLKGKADDILERKLLELTILNEVGKLFAFLEQPDLLLQNALALVSRVIDFDLGAVFAASLGGRLKRVALRYRNVALKVSKKEILRRGVEVLSAEQGSTPSALRLMETSLTEESELRGRHARREPGSELVVILRSPQGPLGMMILYSHRKDFFLLDDRTLVEVIGGQLAMLLENVRLLSEREEKIEILRLEKRRVEAILLNLGEGVLVTDWSYRIIHGNPLAHQLLGVEGERLVGTPLFEHVPKSTFRVLEDQHIGESHPVWDARFLSLREKRPLLARFALVDEEEEKTLGLILLLRDATAEQELDQQKGKFLENVSSEMRDPLTSMRGFLDLLREEMEGAPARQKQYLEVMKNEVGKLTEFVDDLLSLSRIELPDYRTKAESFPVPEAVLHALMSNQEAAEARGIILRTDLAADLPRVFADRDALIDVVNRLISNALKFAPSRSEVLVGARSREREGRREVEVSVRDAGPGIPAERQETIFEKYRPLHHYVGDAGRGSGLGLPICKKLVEMNGGSIQVEAAPGKGSIFSFTLPADQGEGRR